MTTASTYVQFNDGTQDFNFSVDFSYRCKAERDPYGTGDSPTGYEVDVYINSVTLQHDPNGIELFDFLDVATLDIVDEACEQYAIDQAQ